MGMPEAAVQVRADKDYIGHGGVSIWVMQRLVDRTKLVGFRQQVVTGVTFGELGEGATLGEPMRISKADATELMDDLWNAGIRPSDIGTAGHLAATQAHLRDMQGLIEKILPSALRGR